LGPNESPARVVTALQWTRRTLGACVLAGAFAGSSASAQVRVRPHHVAFWAAAGVSIAAAAALDERARRATLDHRSGIATTFADAGNAMGTGRNIIAGLALTYIGARLTHHRRTADGVLRVSAGYAVSNAIVGVLKPVVGRHRPDSTNDAWRFRPFSGNGDLHSFPSSHAVHAFSLAAGVAIASRRSWVGALGYTGATVVAWSRLYDDQHWASDVTTSAVIGIATAATTMDWLDRRFPRRDPSRRDAPTLR
jgi:membrane-associated phospholipid phosphatase